jgi:hypothetical protein
MGFFSGLFSAITTFAKRAWETTKQVVSKAVGWIADKAEVFAGAVGKIWRHVKEKYVAPAFAWAKAKAPWPWLAAAIGTFERVILGFGDSAMGKALKEALEWIIEAARDLRRRVLSAAELTAARIRKALFGEAAANLTEEQFAAVRLAEVINDYVITQSTVAAILEANTVSSFEHYLRLRAAQRLLELTARTLESAQTVASITDDDRFLLEVTTELLAENPQITDAAAERLDRLVRERLGGSAGLVPFVFREMVVAWAGKLDDFAIRLEALSLARSEAEDRARMQAGEVRRDGAASLDVPKAESGKSVQELTEAKLALDEERRQFAAYVNAAEGFLQILEGRCDDREYIASKADRVGKLIIDCAQHGRKWETLSVEEQQLITNFANIFEADLQKRLVTVEISA